MVVQGDDVGADLGTVAVWLVPLQVEAGRRGVTRLRGGREVQEDEGGDRVGICRRGPETHLLAVLPGTCLVHRLSGTQTKTETVREMEEVREGMEAFQDRKVSLETDHDRYMELKSEKGRRQR